MFWWGMIFGSILSAGGLYVLAYRPAFDRWQQERVVHEMEQQTYREEIEHWRQVTGCVHKTLPVLVAQVQSVIAETDQAVIQLSERFQLISNQAKEQVEQTTSLFGRDSVQNEAALKDVDAMLSAFVQEVISAARIAKDVSLAMEQASTSTKSIAESITEIDFIADQTQLLALNAAIEAARVGEHGRGFAVVAEEVSKLAGRSSRAAVSIQELVNAVQTAMTRAMGHVQQLARVDVPNSEAARSRVSSMTHGLAASNQSLQGLIGQAQLRGSELSKTIGQVVMTMQFQDITRQKLQHVANPLQLMGGAFNELLNGSVSEEIVKELQKLETSYTMESERELARSVLTGQTGVLAGSGTTEADDNVTLF
ncbi:MAG: putative Methyl-accepting chemotaxis protein [Nitrospira sp.]|jgi:methyl-accepting chemotaxis protein|nr:putative Methyl-accepting chemotaxis protein [Nitrospira sp.]